MAKIKRQTMVTAGSGYQSIKSTERYTPDTAPINYQSPSPVIIENQNIPHIALEQDQNKPKKILNIREGFLDNIISVYISGQYAIKGHRNLRVREIISLIIHNTGLYRVVVNPQARENIIAIIERSDETLLGERITQYERNRILTIFKRDNI